MWEPSSLTKYVSEHVHCTRIALRRAIIHEQECSMFIVDLGWSSSAIFLVEAVSSKTSMQSLGGYEDMKGRGLSNINLWE